MSKERQQESYNKKSLVAASLEYEGEATPEGWAFQKWYPAVLLKGEIPLYSGKAGLSSHQS